MMKQYILTTCFSLLMTGACLAVDADCPTIDSSELTTFVNAVQDATYLKDDKRYKFTFKDKQWFMDSASRESILEEHVRTHAKSHIKEIDLYDTANPIVGNFVLHRCFYKQKRMLNYSVDTYVEPDPEFRMTYKERLVK